MNEIKVLSFAKINLSIDVKAAMDNGFHEVDMIMQQLSFHDDITVKYEPTDDEDFDIEVKTNRYYLPTDERNLAYKAAQLMISEYGRKVASGKICIDVLKRIPVAAGLAGGSGNGAAVLHGLNVLWKLNLSLDTLCQLGARLGSDVPFCVMGQARANHKLPKSIRKSKMATSCARATGTGTDLKAINKGIRKYIVIAKPRMGVSTASVYKGIDECQIQARPNNDNLINLLMEGKYNNIYDEFINVLEEYTLKAYPEVMELKKKMKNTDAELVLMSGSGPTVFAIYDSIDKAKASCNEMRELKYEAYWTKTTR